MERFEFHILGPLRVLRDGAEVPIRANRELVILATLVLNANRVVSVDRLVEAVWAGEAPSSASRQIAICVSRLRRALDDPEVVRTVSPGYLLRTSDAGIDWLGFRGLVARARGEASHGRTEQAVSLLREALALWHGKPLEGLRGLRYDVERLEESRLEAMESCLELEIEAGRHQQVIPELLELLAEHPFRERVRGQLMLAQYRSGRRAEALRTYRDTRRFLQDQIGLEPGNELRRLHDWILRDEPSLLGEGRRAPRCASPGQLPPQALPFVGRDSELAALDRAVPYAPMVIHGPVGVGKTALALHWAYARLERFPDGQLYADLSDPGACVLDRFLRALGERELPDDPAEKLALYRSCTARRKVLVVLDGAADAAQVLPLLPGGPGCRVIVTSRDPLDELVARQGAQRLRVGPLAADEATELAVRLVDGPAQARELVALSCGNPLSLRMEAVRLQRA